MTHQQRFDLLHERLKNEKPDAALALLRALFLSGMLFVFLAGAVFTVWPLLQSFGHFIAVTYDGVNYWLDEEPVYGGSLRFVLAASAFVAALYLTRHYLLLTGSFALARFEAFLKSLKRKPRPITTKPAPNTDIVAG